MPPFFFQKDRCRGGIPKLVVIFLKGFPETEEEQHSDVQEAGGGSGNARAATWCWRVQASPLGGLPKWGPEKRCCSLDLELEKKNTGKGGARGRGREKSALEKDM